MKNPKSIECSASRSRSDWRKLGLLLLTIFVLGKSAAAAPTLSLQQTSYPGLTPGQSFSVSFILDNPDPITIVAYDYFVRASVANVFSIVGQTFYGPVSNANSLATLPYAVGVSDTTDFGAFNSTYTNGFGPGTTTVQTITFKVDSSVSAGSYTLLFGWNQPSLTGGPSLLDSAVNEYQMASPLLINVSVVPEPRETALLLCAFVLSIAALRARRLRS